MDKLNLNRSQKLKSKTLLSQLFDKGDKNHAYPLLAYSLPAHSNKIAVTVSKKKFRNAVDRNKIKRKMLEEYRLQQTDILKQHSIIVVFIGKSLEDLSNCQKAMSKLISEINDKKRD